MRLPRLTGFAFLVVVAAAIGCGEPTSPVRGDFVLRSVNNEPLPAEMGGVSPGGPTIVLSGSVTLQSDGTAVLVTRTMGGIGGAQTFTRVLRYRLDGFRITIEPTDCPPNAICPLITGVLIGSTLRLDMRDTYQYQRAESDLALLPHWG